MVKSNDNEINEILKSIFRDEDVNENIEKLTLMDEESVLKLFDIEFIYECLRDSKIRVDLRDLSSDIIELIGRLGRLYPKYFGKKFKSYILNEDKNAVFAYIFASAKIEADEINDSLILCLKNENKIIREYACKELDHKKIDDLNIYHEILSNVKEVIDVKHRALMAVDRIDNEDSVPFVKDYMREISEYIKTHKYGSFSEDGNISDKFIKRHTKRVTGSGLAS